MFIYKLIFFIIFITNLYGISCNTSDKKLCVDDQCSVPISLGTTLLRYSSLEPQGLSSVPNQQVKIFSKQVGSVTSLWGAEINGKRGYIPRNVVREDKILNKPTIFVDIKVIEEPQVPNTSENDVKPDKPHQPFEIIAGTKLYMEPPEGQVDFQDTISSSEELNTPLEQETSTNHNTDKKVQETEEDKNDSNNNSFEGNDVHGSKPITKESNTGAFTTYNLQVDQNELHDPKSSSDEPKKFSSEATLTEEKPIITEETSSTIEDTLTKEQFTTDEKSVVEEKSLGNEISSDEGKTVSKEGKSSGTENSSAKEESEENPTSDENTTSEEKSVSSSQHSLNEEKTENDLELPSETLEFKENPVLFDNGIIKAENNSSFISKSLDTSENSKNVDFNTTNYDNSENEHSRSSEKKGSEEQQNIKEENEINSSKENTSKLPVNSWTPTNNPTDEVNHKFPKNAEEIKDHINKIARQLDQNGIESTETLNSMENFNEQVHNVENNPPPTLPPIFPPFRGSLGNLVTPSSSDQENEEKITQNNEIDHNKLSENLNNISPFLDNESKENESDEMGEQDDILPKADLSQPFTEKPLIQERESVSSNQEYLSSKIDDFNGENNMKINQESEENYENPPEYVIAKEDPKVEDTSKSEQEIFVDDTVTEKNVVTTNENPDKIQYDSSYSDESPGIFSTFTSFFDWSGSAEDNENSAIDKIDETNLKCDANIDQFSFNLNSNLVMHLITTIVVFVTFLLFYLSVNKHRIESPLVAKINQLEKDLLVMIKERESLSERGVPEARSGSVDLEEIIQLNNKLGIVISEKDVLEVQMNVLREELEKKENQIENLEKELETSTEVGLELNRLISEMLDPSANGSEKLRENVEQFQRQLQEQTEVIKSMSARLKTKEAENVELLLEIEETKKNAASVQERIQDLVEKVTSIEREKEAQQNALQNDIQLYQSNYNELIAKNEVLNNEIQVLKTKLANSEREIDLKIKECNSLKESFKDISSIKNDNKKLNFVLDTISMKAESDQLKSDLEKYVRELQQNQSEKAIIENKYQSIVQEINELKKRYQDMDKEKLETDMKLEVLNNYFKKREAELQEEVLKYKSIWDAKEGEATSTTERVKLLQEEIENYKTQNEALKQEILSQEIALKSQISVLEKKAHENWVNVRQSERKLEDARQEAAQLRNRLTFRQRNINEEMVQNGLDQNDTTMSSQPSMYSAVSPPLFYDNGRDQVTTSPIPGLPPFLPPPPGAPFVPPHVPNLPGMPLPPPFMPPLPAGFPGDHRPPPLGRMSSPPIKSRYSPDTSAFSPYERGSPSPIYDSEYDRGPYRKYSPYNSDDDRRGYKSPSPLTRSKTRPSKSSLTNPNVNRSNESLEKTNSKKSNMV